MKVKVHKFERDTLAEYFKGKGVEIGTCWGRYARLIAQKNPDTHIYTIDPYKTMYEDEWTHRIGNKDLEKVRNKARKVLAPYKNCKMIRKSSMKALDYFDNGTLDFVYIDGSHHFDYVMSDIIFWGQKVKTGGIISGHNYNIVDVKDAIETYCKAHFVKVLNITKEKSHSWWIEKTW